LKTCRNNCEVGFAANGRCCHDGSKRLCLCFLVAVAPAGNISAIYTYYKRPYLAGELYAVTCICKDTVFSHPTCESLTAHRILSVHKQELSK
jgi:hypothetical protein